MQAPTHSACALHHDRPATDACARCGTFLCLECRRFAPDERVYCATCLRIAIPPSSVRHMSTIGILMMVHGGLLCATGLIFLVAALFFPAMFLSMPPPSNGQGPPDGFVALISGVYGVLTLVHMVPGVMQLIGGNKARQLQSRGFVIASLAAGLGSMFGFYCAPTSIALFIVGLIFVLKDDVTQAFAQNTANN